MDPYMVELDRQALRAMFRPVEEEEEEEEPHFPGRRVDNLGKNVDEWSEQTGNAISTWDLCTDHVAMLHRDPHCFDHLLLPYNGDPPGEDGRGGDASHPNYDDDEYRCFIPNCRVLLSGW